MIYLNNAATSWPKPEEVYRAVDAQLRGCGASFGRGNDRAAQGSAELVYDCRVALAELIHAPGPERIVLTHSATEAANLALKGCIPPLCHVILSDMEHNAVLRPVASLVRERGVELTIAPSDASGVVAPKTVERLLRPNTALVGMVHVSNVTGSRNDVSAIGELCRAAGVPLLVDASQSLGTEEVNVFRDGIDLLFGPGHKGLLGPPGTGFLYVAADLRPTPLIHGGTGSDSISLEQPGRVPEGLEAGTTNLPALAGLLAGVRAVSRYGVANVARHKQRLVQRFVEGLAGEGAFRCFSPLEQRPSLVAFSLDGSDSVEIAECLAEADIAVRAGLHCAPSVHRKHGTLETGMVRVSPGLYSMEGDVDACVERIRAYARGARGARRTCYVEVV